MKKSNSKDIIFFKCFLLLSFSFLSGTLDCLSQNTFPTSGNVGIGTTSPSEKLQVKGNLLLGGSGTKIYWDWPSRSIEQYSSGGISRSIRFMNSWGGSNPDGGFDFAYNDGTSILRIINHKVGVLTTDPKEALDVNGKTRVKNALIVNGAESVSETALLGQVRLSGNGLLGNTSSMYISNENSQGNMYFNVGGKHGAGSHMVIKNSGNIGIGTINPDTKLTVNGTIHTKEVKVDLSGWSDFVFENDYDLPTLEEVANHIAQKGHLKDIPSAAQVEKEGIFLGEMEAKLLQKIEELTLYILVQDKVNKKQAILIEKLEKRINKLENQ